MIVRMLIKLKFPEFPVHDSIYLPRKKGRVRFPLRNSQANMGEKLPIRVVSKHPLHNSSFQNQCYAMEKVIFLL